ncbi:hypothetical protein V495_06630 [Pseudogymnoascus sp. VKM F-4514 (FW-929)]|nr:hypothetical protein V495_06630 [Pseudogymnoascus sp. VKM F-4514 (FW-929)]KFY51630.1 hypothetical protein V497_08971 [Pseudogymnoascus sp. VKM F-4516 (FW-969)]
MAQNSPPPQWQNGDLWDTDPNTFLAREAVKREDLSECYLTDDAIMSCSSTGAKGQSPASRHKGKGAPALAPDGTVMTVLAGTQHNTTVELHGGNRDLPVGNWSVENYQAMSGHPGYKAWLAKIKWTAADALRAGIPLTAINATLTSPPKHTNRYIFGPEDANDSRDNADTPELIAPKLIDPRLIDPALTNPASKGQHSLTNDFNKPTTNQSQERTTAAHPVTPQKTPPKDVPSEYATLPSNHSEITTSPGSFPSSADHSGTAGLKSFDPVASNSAVSEPAPSAPASSKSTTPTIPGAIIPKLVSSLASSEPASPPLTTSEPVTPELATSEPTTPATISKPGTPDSATSEPKNSGPTIPEPPISNLAASEPATSRSIVSKPATPDLVDFQPVSPEPTATVPIVYEPIASETASSESPTAELASSEPVALKSPNLEAAAAQPIVTEPAGSQIDASKPVATEPMPSDKTASEPIGLQPALKPATSDTVPESPSMESFSPPRIETTKNSLADAKPNIARIPLPFSVRQRTASPSLGLMRFGSEPAVGLGIDTGFMEQTPPKSSLPMFRPQSFPRQSSFEIPESPPPSVHRSVLLGGGMSRERTPTISSEATKLKHNNTTVSTGRLGAHYSPTTQPAAMSTGRLVTHYPPTTQATSTVTQATPFQSPPPTPASSGSLKRKATEPLDRLVTFYVADVNSDDVGTFIFSECKLVENAPDFYEQFKSIGRRAHKVNGPVYDVIQKPKIFEAILHWIDKRRVMRKSYSAPDDLECFYLDLYSAAVDNYVLPGLSNAIINKMYDWHSTGTVQFYFGCMMALSTEQFEDTPMEQAAVMVDLFSVAKSSWKGMGAKEAYHDA